MTLKIDNMRLVFKENMKIDVAFANLASNFKRNFTGLSLSQNYLEPMNK